MNKIPIRPLHQEASDRIREMIRKGVLETGQRIVENELCVELGISRTPVREALRSLSAEGLIRLVPNKGAYVSQPSAQEIRELFYVMAILEGACARIAATKLTDQDLAKVEAVHRDLEAGYARRDQEAYIRANNAYHTLIQEMAQNQTLNQVINGLRQKIFLHRYRQLYVKDRFDCSIREHRDLLEAFRGRDADAAEALMKRHLCKQGEALLDSLPEEPSPNDVRRPTQRPVNPPQRGVEA